uniref:Rha family transcriptional regulator n=1 Tax=Serratia marcescens TaxID=615 RepID=A0A9X8VDF1_SERMA
MDKIRSIMGDCEPEWCFLNFKEASREVVQPNGGIATYKCFELTRDAFVLIVMGFTGKKALQWKIDYINAFNKMEAALSGAFEQQNNISEEEIDAYNVQALAKHYRVLYETWKNQIYPALRAIESPLAGRLVDRFKDGSAFLMYVEQAANKRLKPGQKPRIH